MLIIRQAHSRIFSLEEELKAARRKADVEQANEIRMLTHQLSSCHAKIKALETEIIESEDQRKRLAAERIGGGGTSSLRSALRDSEDRFLQSEKLRDEIDFYRRKKLELEAQLVTRDNTILEFRFDAEARREEVERLRRRNAEIEIAFKTLQTIAANHTNAWNANSLLPGTTAEGRGGAGGVSILTREEERILTTPLGTLLGGGGGGGSARPSTSGVPSHIAASKREAELENVIDVLKKVIIKFQHENERLKRGIGLSATPNAAGGAVTAEGGAGGRKAQDLEKRLAAEKKKYDRLEAEHQNTVKRNQELQEAVDKANQRQTQLSNVRNQLKLKENEIVLLTSEVSQFKQDVEQYRQKIRSLEEKIQQLQLQLSSAPSSSQQPPPPSSTSQGMEGVTSVNRQLSQQVVENDLLKKELTELRKKLTLQTSEILYLREQYSKEEARGSGGRAAGGGGGGLGSTSEVMELSRLREENKKLKEELSAFDLDFFEEIENLKFAHAEAVRKLKQYEQPQRR